MNLVKKVMNIFTLKNYLASEGIEVSERMSTAISEWQSLYREKNRLSLPSAIASETARMVTLELNSAISGGTRARFLNEQYQLMIPNLRNIVELACAGGGIVLKPYVDRNVIKLSVVTAENFMPIDYDASGEIRGAAFLDYYSKGNKLFTRVERHCFEKGEYRIYNSAFETVGNLQYGKKISLKETDVWENIEPYVSIRGLDKPLFAYFRMPMANTVDSISPLGVSVFAKAVSLMRDAEEQYGRLIWEFESGERALYVDESAVRRDSNGRHILPDKRLYRLLNFGNDDLFKDWTPNIREESIINGLNEILRRVEFASGLAYGTLSEIHANDRTAEEIRASKERSYSQISDIQNSLKKALSDMIYAMDALCDLYKLVESGKWNVSFEFDDSIAADRKTEFEEKLALLDKGIVAPWEIRVWYLGEEAEEAKKKIQEANALCDVSKIKRKGEKVDEKGRT